MSALGLEVFDRTVQETNTWLQRLEEHLQVDNRQTSYHALRSVLFTLRDRLPSELSVKVAAQLPLMIRGIYYEGYKPSRQPDTFRTVDEWYARITDHYGADPSEVDPPRMTQAVFRLLNEKLSAGLVTKIQESLPEDLRGVWPEAGEPATSQTS